MMRDYMPQDVTAEARAVAEHFASQRAHEAPAPLTGIRDRVPQRESFDPSRGHKEVKIDARVRDEIRFGSDTIDLRGAEQLVDLSQTRAVGCAIQLAAEGFMDGKTSLREVLHAVECYLTEEGLDALDPFYRPEQHPGNFARPRKFEVGAAINRLRSVRMRQKE